jgi:hypothetical protein
VAGFRRSVAARLVGSDRVGLAMGFLTRARGGPARQGWASIGEASLASQ